MQLTLPMLIIYFLKHIPQQFASDFTFVWNAIWQEQECGCSEQQLWLGTQLQVITAVLVL